jgi:serine/threonine-protein kinase HipA
MENKIYVEVTKKLVGQLTKENSDIRLVPAYNIVCTTLYIKNDIPALNLLGSNKWWDEKYLLRFGVESCELSKSDVQTLYDERMSAVERVKAEINIKLQQEKNQAKAELLTKLLGIFSLK